MSPATWARVFLTALIALVVTWIMHIGLGPTPPQWADRLLAHLQAAALGIVVGSATVLVWTI